ncbi:MAG TPA: IS630 family transposase [Chloroflexota bacterium]|nr:IS630 family transposase [Chloroflexota bacterium]
MAARCRGRTDADVPCAHAPRAGALARAVAARTGLAGGRGGGGARARSAHYRGVAGAVLLRRAHKCHVRAHGWLPPALNEAQQAQLKAAVQVAPRVAGIEAGDWNWKGVRTFCRERFGVTLCRSSCLNYLHRLGFVVRRPKKRLLKADETKREAFVREYAVLRVVAQLTKAKIFFVDEAHFYADADLRGTWVLKGEPALVDSTSPRYGEKASYSSAVCLETGEVESLVLKGNSSAETSVAFLQHLRARHPEPLFVIWDNAPTHGGDPLRASLRTPDLHLRLVRLPAYSPDFNADEHIWGWVRAEVTANTCFGTAAKVREHVDPFFAGLAARAEEVQRRCQTVLQTRADTLNAVDAATAILHQARDAPHLNADPTLALV